MSKIIDGRCNGRRCCISIDDNIFELYDIYTNGMAYSNIVSFITNGYKTSKEIRQIVLSAIIRPSLVKRSSISAYSNVK